MSLGRTVLRALALLAAQSLLGLGTRLVAPHRIGWRHARTPELDPGQDRPVRPMYRARDGPSYNSA